MNNFFSKKANTRIVEFFLHNLISINIINYYCFSYPCFAYLFC